MTTIAKMLNFINENLFLIKEKIRRTTKQKISNAVPRNSNTPIGAARLTLVYI
jgi:hypothetical protein